MARILLLSPLQRNTIACIALFITTNIVVISQYWGPRNWALSSSSPSDSDSEDVGDIFFKSESEAQEEEGSILNPPRILLVSALFAFPTAGSSTLNTSHQYLEYLPRFLGSITNDVYFYTTSDLAPAVRAAHGSDAVSDLMIDTSFISPFDIPPLKGRELVYSRMRNTARDIDNTSKDETNVAHSSEILALRNAKMFFLEHAIQSSRGGEENYSDNDYDYVFWVDLTNFNDGQFYASFPGSARVETVWKEGSLLTGSPKEDLLFLPIDQAPPPDMQNWTEDMGPVETSFSQGTFFGGPPRSIKWLSRTFYAYHDYFIQLGFASALPRAQLPSHRMGIVNALLLMYPERFITVWPSDPEVNLGSRNKPKGLIRNLFETNWNTDLKQASREPERGYLGECGDEQLYYRWWLSGHEARGATRNWWNGHPRDSGKLFNDNHAAETAWWRTMVPIQSTPCHLSRVLSVESVLYRTFGEGWQVPTATVTKPTRTW